jgi:6-phosphogluconolactonase
MNIHAFVNADEGAIAAAGYIAAQFRLAVSARRRFTLALSGGTSPLRMFDALTGETIRWEHVHLFQVDERLVPSDSPERNFARVRERLLAHVDIPPGQVYAMPVELDDPKAAAKAYAATLRRVLGADGVLDLVHLGLGADGHTASLLPDDTALESNADVIVSRPYQGFRRLSLSLPLISAARERLWLVTGTEKSRALKSLIDGDRTVPAGRVARDNATVFHSLPDPFPGQTPVYS